MKTRIDEASNFDERSKYYFQVLREWEGDPDPPDRPQATSPSLPVNWCPHCDCPQPHAANACRDCGEPLQRSAA